MTGGNAAPGWYPPDPARPHDLRYWDGSAWTDLRHAHAGPPPETAPVRAVRRSQPWWVSWPVIVVGFMLCLIPGVVLLWLRRGPRLFTKIAATAVVVAFFAITLSIGGTPTADPAAAHVETSASPGALTPSASATPSGIPSASPSPSASTPPPSASPTPTEATSSAAEPTPAASDGTAAAALAALTVKGEASSAGYSRDQFGDGWVDVDGNGCGTRDDMLALRLDNTEMSGSCTVTAGDLADPFTGEWIHFERGGASEVDIDHLVALSAAWTTGAQDLTYSERVSLANDPLNLEPVDAGANRSKGDDDASEWLPPAADFRCEYVARQVAVKTKYGLWVTQRERDAMADVLDTCPGQQLPAPGDQPVISSGLGEAPRPTQTAAPEKTVKPKQTSTPKETPAEAAEPKLDKRYEYCNRLPAGLGPYVKGVDPEYEWYTDRDGDGVVCE